MKKQVRCVWIVLAVLASACAGAESEDRGERKLDADVVDLRGIWGDRGLNLEAAIDRGLDTSDIQVPVQTRRRRPGYPIDAITSKTTGTVILDCIIDESGITKDCRAHSGPPVLLDAAKDAVEAWRWEPLRIDGRPRQAAVYLQVTF